MSAGNMFGGVESMLVTMARERGRAPSLEAEHAVCFEDRLARDLAQTDVPVHLLGAASVSRPWSIVRARRRLEQILQAGRFDVIVSHGCWAHGLAAPAARAAGVSTALFLHDPVQSRHWVERWAGSSPPDFLLANSRFTRASATALFAGREVAVLHPPVAAPLELASGARERVRATLGAGERTFVILMTCRLERWKGHELLLQALTRLTPRPDCPDWTCWIAGGPQRSTDQRYLEALQAQARAAGLSDRISWLGQRADVPELLAAADVHCQPNVGPEPFGVAFVEALWSKVPVVTTALGGALEVVDDTCGVLVRPDDPDELARALGDLMDHPAAARTLGAAGPARARAICDPGQQLACLHAALARPAAEAPSRSREPGWVAAVGGATRRLPRGRYVLYDLACRAVSAVGLTPTPFLARIDTRGGAMRFVCDLRDKNAREVCFTRRYEPQERGVIEMILRPGDTFVDVGANWGYFTLVAAMAIGPRGRAIALEPDPRMIDLLRENVHVNHLDQVTCLHMAASDRPGELELVGFDEEGGNWGVSSIAPPTTLRDRRTFRIEARPMDALLDELGVRTVHLLKMDIEGAEDLALSGMRRGLAEHRYAAVLLELHPRELAARGCSTDAVTNMLREAGYVGWSIDHSTSATRRASYARQFDPRSVLRPLQPEAQLDLWPHQLWVPPGRGVSW